MPDQCLGWDTAYDPSGKWTVSRCANLASQLFNAGQNESLCVKHHSAAEIPRCVMPVGILVHSATVRSENPHCAANLSLEGSLAAQCNHKTRCEYELQLDQWDDPAPGCKKELVVVFSCPHGFLQETRIFLDSWHWDFLRATLQSGVN
jgi:hypothetical protein